MLWFWCQKTMIYGEKKRKKKKDFKYLILIEGIVRITIWRARTIPVIRPKPINAKICNLAEAHKSLIQQFMLSYLGQLRWTLDHLLKKKGEKKKDWHWTSGKIRIKTCIAHTPNIKMIGFWLVWEPRTYFIYVFGL